MAYGFAINQSSMQSIEDQPYRVTGGLIKPILRLVFYGMGSAHTIEDWGYLFLKRGGAYKTNLSIAFITPLATRKGLV
jgi:hypothetical protein